MDEDDIKPAATDVAGADADGDGEAGLDEKFFTSDDEMNEVAVGLALSGQTLEEALEYLENFYGEKLARVEVLSASDLAAREKAVGLIEGKLCDKEGDLARQREGIERLKKERAEIETKIRLLYMMNQDAWQRIRQHRFERGKKFFEEHKGHLAEALKRSREEVLNGVEHQLRIDERLFEIDKKNRVTNAAEFERRVKFCEAEKERVEGQLTEAEKYSTGLKRVGVTRKSASFLFYTGYVSLAGVGGVVASLLQDRQPTEDVITRLMLNIISLVDALVPEAYAVWRPALRLPLFVLLITFFFILFNRFIRWNDKRIKEFDENWAKPTKEGLPGRRRRGAEKPNDPFAGLGAFLTLKSQLSNYTSLDIERKDYTRLLASLPYILLGALVVFLFSGVARPGELGRSLTLTTASIGIVFALVSAIAALLYVTRFVKPRWATTAAEPRDENEEQKLLVPRYLRLNAELAALVALMVVSLGIAAFLPTMDQQWLPYLSAAQLKLISWGGVAIFMCLAGSFGLAYGIVQRGIFRDVDYLRSERGKFCTWIEEFSYQPIIGESEYASVDAGEDPTRGFLRRQSWLDRLRAAYELNEVFGEDYELEESPRPRRSPRRFILDALSRVRGKPPVETDEQDPTYPVFYGLKLKSDIPAEPRLIDHAVAPEETKTFLLTKLEIEQHVAGDRALAEELRRLGDDIRALRGEIDGLLKDLTAAKTYQTRVARSYERTLNTLSVGRAKEMMKFRASFAMGEMARKLLQDEKILPEAGGGEAAPVALPATEKKREANVVQGVPAGLADVAAPFVSPGGLSTQVEGLNLNTPVPTPKGGDDGKPE